MQVGRACRRDKFHLQSPAARDGAVLSDASLAQAFQTQSIIRRGPKPEQLGRTPLCSSNTLRHDYKAVYLLLMPEKWWLCLCQARLLYSCYNILALNLWFWIKPLKTSHCTANLVLSLIGKCVSRLFKGFIGY